MIDCDSYDSVNIDSGIKPTWKIGVGERFPCQTEHYDTVISFNTLEHIFDPLFTISEMARVMKIGAQIVISTPFLFPIHGHPNDYFRPTPSWYLKTLVDAGLKEVEVIPLFWGPFSAGQTCSGIPGPAKAIRKQVALLLDYIYANASTRTNADCKYELNETHRSATGFFIFAKK